MATLINAIQAVRPRLVSKGTVGLDELALRLSRGSLVTHSIARMVLQDLSDEIRVALLKGHAVTLPDLVRFRLSLGLDGRVRPRANATKSLRTAFTTLDDTEAEVLRRENIGLSLVEVVRLWDEAHPEDPVELPPGMDLAA